MKTLATPGFHHIGMVSREGARTLAFYGEVLGMHRLDTPGDAPRGSFYLAFGDREGAPGTILVFRGAPEAGRGGWGNGGVHHLALGAEDEAALLKWKRRLVDRGIPVSGPYDRGWFRSIYFTDPDGQILEIATRGPGYAIDEPADRLGSQVIMPKASQLRGHRDEEAIRAAIHPEPVEEITAEIALQGIHHITGITPDIEAADRFYTEVLGLRRVKKSVNQDSPEMPHWFWARYDGAEVAAHSSFTLFGWPGFRRARTGVGQTDHVAFRASDGEELLQWGEHLREQGVEVSEVLDRTHFQSIRFRAPDGLLLEIATDLPGFAPRGAPRAEAVAAGSALG